MHVLSCLILDDSMLHERFVSIWLWATVCGSFIHGASDPKTILRALMAVAAGMGCGVASLQQDCSRRLCNLP